MEELGSRIRSLRKKRHWTQTDLAARCGSTTSGISQLERGEIQSPRADLLYAIAHALNVDADYLRTGDGDPHKQTCSPRAAELVQIFDGLTGSQQEEILERIREIRRANEEIYATMNRLRNKTDE